MAGLLDEQRFEKFVAGGLAGALSKSAIAPFDRVKVLFQTTTRLFSLKNGLMESNRIWSQEGITAFWKGNCAQLLRITPYAAIVRLTQQFGTFDYYKERLPHLGSSKLAVMVSNFLPGSLAGASAVLCTYPFEIARTRLAIQTTRRLYRGTLHAFWRISQDEGVSALYKGLTPTIIGIVVYSGTAFCIYFGSKDLAAHQSSMGHFLYGAMAGVLGQLSAYPFDVVRKKMQAHGFIERVSNFKSTHSSSPFQYFLLSRSLDFVSEIWHKEGLRGFFKGFSVNLVKAPIGAGILHTVNELMWTETRRLHRY